MIELLRGFLADGGPVMFAIVVVSTAAWVLLLALLFRVPRRVQTADAPPEPLHAALHCSARHRREFRAGVEPLLDAGSGRLEAGFGPLAALTALLPLLGLLGTVLGMLTTFEAIQRHGTGDPRMMAEGIRHALLTTQAGLLTAVPILFLLRMLRSRVRRMLAALELAVRQVEAERFQGEA